MKFFQGILRLINWVLCALLLIVLVQFSIDRIKGDVKICQEEGGLWDPIIEACRYDCKSVDQDKGCDVMSLDELRQQANRYCPLDAMDTKQCRAARFELFHRQEWLQQVQ